MVEVIMTLPGLGVAGGVETLATGDGAKLGEKLQSGGHGDLMSVGLVDVGKQTAATLGGRLLLVGTKGAVEGSDHGAGVGLLR